MKMIKDERLKIQNLKNIRIAYIIQTAGILAILGYDLVTKGFDEMMDNPLWFVFMISTIVSAYLSMSISADHESTKKNPKKSLWISIAVLSLITAIFVLVVSLTDGINMGLMIGGIIFICGIAPIIYLYYLRLKRDKDITEE